MHAIGPMAVPADRGVQASRAAALLASDCTAMASMDLRLSRCVSHASSIRARARGCLWAPSLGYHERRDFGLVLGPNGASGTRLQSLFRQTGSICVHAWATRMAPYLRCQWVDPRNGDVGTRRQGFPLALDS